MLDLKFIRENPGLVRERAALKNIDADVDGLLADDERRRQILVQTEELKRERNELSAEIGKLLKAGADADEKKMRVRRIGQETGALDTELAELDERIRDRLLSIPNLPHESVIASTDPAGNAVVRVWGEPLTGDASHPHLPHWEIAEKLDLIDFARGTNISGSGFPVYTGVGARLQRALIAFMLDYHTTRHGFREIYPPYLVTRQSMTGTGQLPKFEEELYHASEDDLFLIPTAEVPVTNLHAGEILDGAQLPVQYVAYTPCFRREAGSYGKDTRGITRVHQFDKVEMVLMVRPDESFDALEALVGRAEAILQALGLHYRVVSICSGDMGFSGAKQYDLEVWAPGMQLWLEVSSVTNFTDYQGRRANIRFRPAAGAKPEFVHTLNGSGLALPRTMIALLETFQQHDGSILLPEPLRPFMGTDRILPPA